MARDLTAGMVTEMKAVRKEPLLLVEMLFDSGALRLWTGYGDLSFNGFTWTGTGHLLAISPITETAETKQSGMSFVLSGVPSSILSLVEGEDYQGRTLRIYLAMRTAAGALVASPYESRRLRMDTMEDVEDGDTATITLTAQDETAFERPVERRYTNEDQHLDFPNDDFFEFVPDLQEKEIVGRVA